MTLVDRLQSDEHFTTIALQAAAVALRTHEQEKLDALRNAVLNAALMPTIHEAQQQMFISLLDGFTAWHLRLLRFFSDQDFFREEFTRTSSPLSLRAVIVRHFPELEGPVDIYSQMIREIGNAGLVVAEVFELHSGLPGLSEESLRWITANEVMTVRGRQFLAFVLPPATVPCA